MTSKFAQRPGSSARVYDDDNSNYGLEKKSRIPRLPKRTYSLEGKITHSKSRRSSSQHQSSTSMIPRPEWKNFKKISKPGTPHQRRTRPKTVESHRSEKFKDCQIGEFGKAGETRKDCCSRTVARDSPLEYKINTDFNNFKKNILRIPEYWTDAGHTVSNILKNAINIVAKQYPSADVESFETEIQNIIKATEAVKQQIVAKTENIIHQANKAYLNKDETEEEPSEEELMMIIKRMEDLRSEVHVRKNAMGGLLKCGSEMKKLAKLEKALKSKVNNAKDVEKSNDDAMSPRRMEGKKLMRIEDSEEGRRRDKNTLQSCGDILRHDRTSSTPRNSDGKTSEHRKLENKSSQTINFCTAELLRREEALNVLNHQILELHQLCKDHISKFKSFNLQIKLRGICNKAQHLSATREIQILNDEKLQLVEKNNKLQFYNKDLESAIKQRDLDLHQKDKLINQQKKLLHVRDELIEMLKSRCNIQEVKEA